MQAPKFEFERRFWIFCAFYFAGFGLSAFDHVSFLTWLRQLFGIPGNSAQAVTFARVVILIGAVLVFIAAALRTWGAAYLRTSIVHDTDQHSEAVVADGPFRYTRNPLYLARVLMALGIGVLAIAISLNVRLGLLLFAAGLLAHFTITRWTQRRG